MKKITYYNKELKEIIDFSKGITDDDYETKELTLIVEDSDLDYYLDIINKSYGEFGDVKTEDFIVLVVPTTEERLESLENALSALMEV